jgi:hypothetical protein
LNLTGRVNVLQDRRCPATTQLNAPSVRAQSRGWIVISMTLRRVSGQARRVPAAAAPLAMTLLAVVLTVGCAGGGTGSASGPQVSPIGAKRSASARPAWQLKALARRYLAIATPANHRLDVANDGFEDHERDDLHAAEADLRTQTATERWFDRHLAKISFPPAIEAMARALIEANETRIRLTGLQAGSGSLIELRSFDHGHAAADQAVENEVKLIRKALRLPPPSSS